MYNKSNQNKLNIQTNSIPSFCGGLNTPQKLGGRSKTNFIPLDEYAITSGNTITCSLKMLTQTIEDREDILSIDSIPLNQAVIVGRVTNVYYKNQKTRFGDINYIELCINDDSSQINIQVYKRELQTQDQDKNVEVDDRDNTYCPIQSLLVREGLENGNPVDIMPGWYIRAVVRPKKNETEKYWKFAVLGIQKINDYNEITHHTLRIIAEHMMRARGLLPVEQLIGYQMKKQKQQKEMQEKLKNQKEQEQILLNKINQQQEKDNEIVQNQQQEDMIIEQQQQQKQNLSENNNLEEEIPENKVPKTQDIELQKQQQNQNQNQKQNQNTNQNQNKMIIEEDDENQQNQQQNQNNDKSNDIDQQQNAIKSPQKESVSKDLDNLQINNNNISKEITENIKNNNNNLMDIINNNSEDENSDSSEFDIKNLNTKNNNVNEQPKNIEQVQKNVQIEKQQEENQEQDEQQKMDKQFLEDFKKENDLKSENDDQDSSDEDDIEDLIPEHLRQDKHQILINQKKLDPESDKKDDNESILHSNNNKKNLLNLSLLNTTQDDMEENIDLSQILKNHNLNNQKQD